jgi:2-oxoglutarate ferredoxin oxidoreductase subunit delta
MIADPETLERADPEPRPPKKRLPKGEIHIFDNWCKGCGLCIEFCPPGVLALGTDNRPKAIYPEKCTVCRWCELHCPDFAIFVSRVDHDASDSGTGDDQQALQEPAAAEQVRPVEPAGEELETEDA